MDLIQRKNSNFLAISCLVLLLLALEFRPLQAISPIRCPKGHKGRTRFPELVGVPGCNAAGSIKSENINFFPTVLPEGTPVPEEFRCERVWVFINGTEGTVARVPRVG